MEKITIDLHSKFFQLFSLCGLSLALGFLFDYLIYDHAFGINVPIFIFIAITFGILLALSYRVAIPKLAYLFFAIGLGFAFLLFFRANALLSFCNFCAMGFFLLLGVIQLTEKFIHKFLAFDYWKTLALPLFFVPPFLKTLQDLITIRHSDTKRDTAIQIIRGTIVALVIVAVLLALFASADLVVQDFFTRLFSNELDAEQIAEFLVRTFFVTFIAGAFLGLYAYAFRHPRVHAPTSDATPVKFIKSIELGIILIATNLIFITFLTIQATNLFGGHNALDRLGITYAEYAQRGFFELIVAALLVALVLWIADKYSAKNTVNEKTSFLFLSSLLLVQTIVLMASAFYRLALYEGAYGYTTLRLFSHAFIIWIALALVYFLVKIWFAKKEEHFALATFGTGVVLLLALNALNPDAFMATQHLQRAAGTETFDAPFLSQLSADAVPVLYEAMRANTDARLPEVLADWKGERFDYSGEKGPATLRSQYVGWQAYHFARTHALDVLADVNVQR
ncbi:MAG: DUF4173 domain-containing protein [Patescibacteria group bacterium]